MLSNGNYLQPLCSGSGNGRVLDISRKGGALDSGQNVQIWTKDSPKEDQSQLWYIYYGSVENSFRFKPKYNTNFDLATNSMSRGTTGGNTAASPGNVYIENSNYSNLYQDWYLELLSAPAESVTLSQYSATLSVGGTVTLKATVWPDNANQAVAWSSSNSGVATVNGSGVVTAKSAGTATITAKADNGKYATCSVTVKNRNFNTAYTTSLKSSFNSLLGSGKKPDNPVLNLLYKYTPAQCIDIILSYDSHITNLCNTSGFYMPKALVQSLLMRELWCVNSSDDLADTYVIEYFTWKVQCENWEDLPIVFQLLTPYPEPPLIIRSDSSTGLGQMFAETGINAHNNAVNIGLLNASSLSASVWRDCYQMWNNLRMDNNFNIKMVYYEIFNCARKNGETSRDFSQYSASQIKALLARYNGSGSAAVQYGAEVYEYYLIFSQYNNY